MNFTSTAIALVVISIWSAMVVAAPPTADTDTKVVGKWQVSSQPGLVRMYTITAGRNLKIDGSGIASRTGKLSLQSDGSYLAKLDGDAIQRIVYDPAKDQLQIKHWSLKKDFDRGLAPTWSTSGKRMTEK